LQSVRSSIIVMRGPSTYSYIGDVASEDLKSITTFRILLVVPSNRTRNP
jgi:hypothetical protein